MKIKKYFFIIYFCFFGCWLYSKETNYNLPYIEEYQLANGLRILVSPNYDNPIVHVNVNINVTKFDVPKNKVGLALSSYSDNMLSTKKYSNEDTIHKKLISLGSEDRYFESDYTGRYRTSISHYFLKSDLNDAVELLSEVLIYPTFKMKFFLNVETYFSNILEKMFFLKESDHTLVDAHADYMHANIINSINEVINYSRKDKINWYKSYIRPENITLMFTGDINPIYIKKLVSAYFGKWNAPTPAPEKNIFTNNIIDSSGIKVRFINVPNNKDVRFAILKTSPNLNDKLFHEGSLAHSAFGDKGFSSRLSKIHSKFDNYSFLQSTMYPLTSFPSIYIDGKMKYENFDSLYREIHNEFIILSNKSITQEELDRLKTIQINSYNNKLFKPDVFNQFIQQNYNFNGYSLNKISEKWDKINNATLDDVNLMASKIFDPNNYIIVILGDKDSSATLLNDFENVDYYEQTEKLR